MEKPWRQEAGGKGTDATAALHNHLLVLTLLGRWAEAKSALEQHRGLGRASSGALALRLRAMEGRVCRGPSPGS